MVDMKWTGWIFTIAVIVAISYSAISISYPNIQTDHFSTAPILVSIVAGLLYRSLCALVWIRILRLLDDQASVKIPGALVVFSTAWLARYIPGKLAGIATKTYMGPTAGMPRQTSAIAAISESVIQLASTLLLCAILLMAEPRLSENAPFVLSTMLLIALLLITLLYRPIFERTIQFCLRWSGRKIVAKPNVMGLGQMIASAGFYALGAMISGVGFFLLALGFAPDHVWDYALFLIAAYNVAGVLGMIAFFAPSGIGIKDGALLFSLTVILPYDIALLLTVVARAWVLAVDLLFFWLVKLNARVFRYWRASFSN